MRKQFWLAGTKIRGWGRLLILAAIVSVSLEVAAQNDSPMLLIADGAEPIAISTGEPPAVVNPVDVALSTLHDEGYLFASVDSTTAAVGQLRVYATRGGLVTVGAVEIVGTDLVDTGLLQRSFGTQPGAPFRRSVLAQDLRSLLRALDSRGRPLATAAISDLEIDGLEAFVTIEVTEGPQLIFSGLDLGPESRTDPAFAARLIGMQPGSTLSRYDPAIIRRDLQTTGLFAEVGQPELALDAAGDAVIVVPVDEGQPGAFDLVLGYLPPSPGESGQLIGSGTLALRNLFGRARSLNLELVRNPGLVSSIDVSASDPFVLGLPLRIEGRFTGYQQDSTFNRQSLRLESGYRFAPGLEVFAAGTREIVEAGIAGSQVVDGRLVVPDARAWFGGVGLRFERVDRPLNPRSGLVVSTMVEQGTKRRKLQTGSEEPINVSQQRLHAGARVFIPTLARQALVLGGDAAVILGDVYDDSDLFRFGGATSLRGYDEERFRGNVVGRALTEYRYQLDPTSFAFVFFDLGYIRRPETAGLPADERLAPGYGLGLQYRTPLGLVTASFGMNPDDGPARGNVHVGLSVGL